VTCDMGNFSVAFMHDIAKYYGASRRFSATIETFTVNIKLN